MTNRKKTLIALTGLALVAVPAADTFAQSASPSETWTLAEVAGNALPALVETDSDGCREEVLAGTLTLATDGTWTLTTREREQCGDEIEEESEDENGRYVVEGETVRFLDEDGNPEDADDGDNDIDVDDLATGTRSGATLTVRLADGATTLLFRRS